MDCGCDTKTATYNNEIHCKICGMDLGLKPTSKTVRGIKELFCCESCRSKKT